MLNIVNVLNVTTLLTVLNGANKYSNTSLSSFQNEKNVIVHIGTTGAGANRKALLESVQHFGVADRSGCWHKAHSSSVSPPLCSLLKGLYSYSLNKNMTSKKRLTYTSQIYPQLKFTAEIWTVNRRPCMWPVVILP